MKQTAYVLTIICIVAIVVISILVLNSVIDSEPVPVVDEEGNVVGLAYKSLFAKSWNQEETEEIENVVWE